MRELGQAPPSGHPNTSNRTQPKKFYITLHKNKMQVSSATTAIDAEWKVDPKKCIVCGDCVVICPVGALKMENKVAAMVDPASCCRESCRICEYHCCKGAIRAY